MHDVYENTVRFAETDAQGIVFYGNYATFQDETFAAFMDAVGFPYEDTRRNSWDVHVVNLDLNFRSQARFRDSLVNAMRASFIGESSLTLEYQCRQASDDTVVVDGTVTHVAVDEDGAPTRIPDDFRTAVADFQEKPPETE